MNSKKILAVLLAVAMAFSAAACTKKGNTSSSGAATSPGVGTEQTEVDIFQFKVEISDALTKAAKTYMDANPKIKININTVGGGDDYGAALRAKMQSGAKPDIFNVGGPQDLKDWAEKLEDLSDQPWVKNAVEGTLLAVTENGKTYGLPYAIEGYGLIYNRAIFETAGIATEKIKTYAEIESAMKTLKGKIDKGELKQKYPSLEAVFELPAKETWVTGLHTLNLPLAAEFKGPIEAFKSPTVKFTYANELKALIDLQASYTKHAKDLGKLNAVDYATQVGSGLATERVAMVQQGNWIYGEVANVDEDVARNLDLLPLPLKGVVEDSIPVGVPMYWCINSTSSDAKKKASKDFLNWLYQSEEGKRIVVEEFGFIPAFTNYENLEPADPLGKAVKRYADAGKTVPWVFMGFPTAWGQDVFGSNLQKYFAGQMKWEDVLKDSRVKWEEARKNIAGSSSSSTSSSSASSASPSSSSSKSSAA
ncbi:extracellular solute-binding protein [Hydrogenoanaerobacterium sp.]|uniref:ABC transporter substrate-binding protein n=1 Tax=Hydrogenoanaerobacterium sp. TaxID=2953763 RepID=UPI00289D70C5|nr:extracellular solute-binding protein [Hydrogenoanaerobacterium sp.]